MKPEGVIERQRNDSVFTGVCFAIEYRLDFGLGLRVTGYPVKTSEHGISLHRSRLTLADSGAYGSEFRGEYLENPCFESRLGTNRVNEVTFYDRFQVPVAIPGSFTRATIAR